MSDEALNDMPTAIKEAAERVRKAKEGATPPAAATPPVTPVNAEPTATPPANPQPVPAAVESEVEALRAKAQRLQTELDRREGKYGSTLDTLRAQMSQMQEAVELLKTENAELRAAKVDPKPAGQARVDSSDFEKLVQGVDADGRKAYGDELLGIVATMIRNGHTLYGNTVDLAPLQAEVETVRKSSAAQRFIAAVNALAPGFSAFNGDSEAKIAANPAWAEFLDTVMNPDVDAVMTWRTYLGTHGTPEVTANVFKRFQAMGKAPKPTAGKVDVAGQAAVRSTGTPPPSPTAGEKPKLRMADYEVLKERMRRPSTEFTIEENNENKRKLREFQLAAQEGRLVP